MVEQKDDGYIRFHCRMCGKRLKIKKELEGGGTVKCPRCGELVTVPFANLEAIAQAEGLSDDTARKNINRLDPDLLMRQLRGDENGGKKGNGAASAGTAPTRKWTPELTYGTIEALDSLRARLNKIEDDTVGDIQRLLRMREKPRDEILSELDKIAQDRQKEVRDYCRGRLQDLKEKLRALEAHKGVLGPAAVQRLDKLQRSVDALELYLFRVLHLEL